MGWLFVGLGGVCLAVFVVTLRRAPAAGARGFQRRVSALLAANALGLAAIGVANLTAGPLRTAALVLAVAVLIGNILMAVVNVRQGRRERSTA